MRRAMTSVPLGRSAPTKLWKSWSAETVREDEVEAASDLLERAGVAGVDEVVRAQLEGFGFLVLGGGEGCDFAAECAGELQADVAEAANADDADTGRGTSQVVAQRA